MRSRHDKFGIIPSVLMVMLATWVFPGNGNDLPAGGQEQGKSRMLQEISSSECCARDPAKDIDGLAAAGNEDPEGIWSDGTTMWVADAWTTGSGSLSHELTGLTGDT